LTKYMVLGPFLTTLEETVPIIDYNLLLDWAYDFRPNSQLQGH